MMYFTNNPLERDMVKRSRGRQGPLQNDEAQKEKPASPERGWLAQSFALKLGCEENKNARPV